MTRVDGRSLQGVSTTALRTLRSRALESGRPRGLIDDPWAEGIYGAIDLDYGVFGPPRQFHTLRALAFDRYTREFLRRYPKASVVARAVPEYGPDDSVVRRALADQHLAGTGDRRPAGPSVGPGRPGRSGIATDYPYRNGGNGGKINEVRSANR